MQKNKISNSEINKVFFSELLKKVDEEKSDLLKDSLNRVMHNN